MFILNVTHHAIFYVCLNACTFGQRNAFKKTENVTFCAIRFYLMAVLSPDPLQGFNLISQAGSDSGS